MRRFKAYNELVDHFFWNHKRPEHAREGCILVDTKLRREVLTGVEKGEFVMNGRVHKLAFKSAGGGVWECRAETKVYKK